LSRIAVMQPIVTDGVAPLSVCLLVSHDREPCKNKWTSCDVIWIVDSDGPRNHVLHGVHIGTTWWIRFNRPYTVAMRPFCQVTLITCLYMSTQHNCCVKMYVLCVQLQNGMLRIAGVCIIYEIIHQCTLQFDL